MAKGKKLILIIILVTVTLLLLWSADLIGYKSSVKEKNGVGIKMKVTKLLVIAKVEVSIENWSNKEYIYRGRNTCDINTIHITGNDSFYQTYEDRLDGKNLTCGTTMQAPIYLSFGESWEREVNFYKLGISERPIEIKAVFEESGKDMFGIENEKTKQENEKPFKIDTSVTFKQ